MLTLNNANLIKLLLSIRLVIVYSQIFLNLAANIQNNAEYSLYLPQDLRIIVKQLKNWTYGKIKDSHDWWYGHDQ